ncbi:MAG: hypothetical protein M1835_003304 [Candelina submexicana]|nr:MAG: hypothetical protein M1835_003304 [Candelina submexicana]
MVANTNRNVIAADQLDEAFEPSEIDHQAAANEVGAGMNRELIREEAPFIQDVRTTDAEKAEPQELILNLSPFSEDESIQADDFWLDSSFEKFQEEK